jgi:hypothetical protein
MACDRILLRADEHCRSQPVNRISLNSSAGSIVQSNGRQLHRYLCPPDVDILVHIAELDALAPILLQMSASVTVITVATHSYDQMFGHIGHFCETFTAMTICRGAGDLQNLAWPVFVVFPPHL